MWYYEKNLKDWQFDENWSQTINDNDKNLSAGILIYRYDKNFIPEFYLCKYGGPIWKNKVESWGIPKGHVEINEGYFDAAKREFYEETGIKISSKNYINLKSTKSKTGKKVIIYSTYFNVGDNYKIISNTCFINYKNRILEIQEMDEGKYFKFSEAIKHCTNYQIIFLKRLYHFILTTEKVYFNR